VINTYIFYKRRPLINHQQKKLKKWNERKEEQISKKVVEMVIGLEKIACRLMEKCARSNFVLTWTINVVRQANNCSHNTFKTRFRPHPLRYIGVNLGFTTSIQ
jgi:hypothetical protein